MDTLHPSDASRNSRTPDDAPAADETLAAHARRALLARLRARVTAVLDAGIALLQGLREKAGGAQAAEEDEDRPDARRDRARERQESAPPAEAEAPRPRRLRAALLYLGLILAGGLGGGALAYSQFQTLLERQREVSQEREAALAKKTQPDAAALKTFEAELLRRDQAEKKLASAFAAFSESTDTSYTLLKNLLGQQFAENRRLEMALAENTRSSAATRQALEQAQAARIEAETRLASSLAEHTKLATEKQQQLDAAEKQLATLLDSAAPSSVQQEAPVSRRNDSSRARPPRPAKLTLNSQNIGALKGCIDEFNQ